MHAQFLLPAFAAALLPIASALPYYDVPEPRAVTERAYSPLSRLNPNITKAQLNQVKLSTTEVEKLQIIRSFGKPDDYFKFDFTPAGFASNAGNGQGGQGFLANVQNYPALMNTGLSMAIGFLKPCGLDSMHVHNRATEFLILVNGTSLHTGFVQEDGLYDPVLTTLGLYQGTIRPQGSVHYEFNDNCEPAVFVTGLSSEDPGVSRTAPAFFGEDPALVWADLGYPPIFNQGKIIPQFAKNIPAAFSLGSQACLKRCGITYNSTQH